MEEWMFALQTLPQESEALRTRCNEVSERFGLTLSQAAMERLQKHRCETLQNTGRIEFGTGVLAKLVTVFCDCPYLAQSDYEQTLCELQEQFYSFKNECRELVSDDELIEAMRLIYSEVFRGSTEALAGVDWQDMVKIARSGSLAGTALERPPLGGYNEEE